SKATGFPIARIGAKLAVGYRLDELPNDITKSTPASFEPVLDYVVAKFPRFAFEKFPAADPTLGVQLKAVGVVMAIGRTFKQAWQKGLRGLETGLGGWETGARPQDDGLPDDSPEALRNALRRPTAERPAQLKRALQKGFSIAELHELTAIDPWFLAQLAELVEAERWWVNLGRGEGEGTAGTAGVGGGTAGGNAGGGGRGLEGIGRDELRRMKRLGFSDRQLAKLRGVTEREVRELRHALGVRPTYHMVDTCAGEFPAATPYLYSAYEDESEAPASERPKVMILGSGPNRIGQGIEFDYCCVQAALALKEDGFETIMVNSNPETVSTDFDIADKLYFEPLTLEDVIEIVERERPVGVIVQLGG